AGLAVLAADMAGEPLPSLGAALAAPTAWLFGNEAHGLSAEARGLADRTVAVPLYGPAESLNLATAAAVCLYASAFAQRA
ncbi:MAG TPA: TrmH family RNA methyltransferase, partial [Amnibacterium sp.]|nr:TrmH family RNA methyltransferase [Amnibacterium sp.]